MKHKTKLLTTLGIIAAIGIIGYSVISYAHGAFHKRYGGHDVSEWSEHGGKHKGASMFKLMERYDENGDQALTLDEVLNARSTQFKTYDTNKDGVLELSEYEALWLNAMRERMVDRFQKHDNDGDGKISPEDFSRKYSYMMHRMDRNEDGKVDASDMRRHHKKDDD